MISSTKTVHLHDLCWYIIDINSLIFCNQLLCCALMWHITFKIHCSMLHFDLFPIFAPKQHILYQNTWALHYDTISTLARLTSLTVNQTVVCSFQLEVLGDARLKLQVHYKSCRCKVTFRSPSNTKRRGHHIPYETIIYRKLVSVHFR